MYVLDGIVGTLAVLAIPALIIFMTRKLDDPRKSHESPVRGMLKTYIYDEIIRRHK